ncbi:hypothetical protein [Chitinophaga sp. MM2321]|uniref:hypothetical protein n=1 Tax=Chitinophaga sp. MM2321 TaxID=3137178 RepID=UPI0032D5A923
MKNLPAFGILIVLVLFIFFQGTPGRQLQAAPVSNNELASFQQDTLPPMGRDTSKMHKHGKKKDWKMKDTTMRKDTLK